MAKAKSTGQGSERQGELFNLGRNHVEYRIWYFMLLRCTDKRYPGYDDYGGRGIKVCERWLNSFDAFLADMGKRPTKKHSVDRINNDGDYTPENCRWATREEQVRNTRRQRTFTLNGETKHILDWSKLTGISVYTLHARRSLGWTDEKALTTPVQKQCRTIHTLSNSELDSLYHKHGSWSEVARQLGCSLGSLRKLRGRRGMSKIDPRAVPYPARWSAQVLLELFDAKREWKKVAAFLGVNPTTLTAQRRKAGLPTRGK